MRQRAPTRQPDAQGAATVPPSVRALRPMTDGIVPITIDERRARIDKARRLMAENRIDAILVEGGIEHVLFHRRAVGPERAPLRRRHSRPRASSRGSAPAFEEARARELIKFGTDIRTWQEDESPYRAIAQIFKDRGIATGRIGVEERLRFFIMNGVKTEAPALDYVSADPVTAGCRMIKSPAEIALMQRANDMTIAAYKAGLATLREGMTQGDLRDNILGGLSPPSARTSRDVAVSFGEYTRVSARQRHAAETEGRRRRPDRRRMQGGRLLLGHHPDGRLRQADAAADRRVEPRAAARRPPRSPPRSRACRAKRSMPPRAR